MRAHCHKDANTDGRCTWENIRKADKKGYTVQCRQAQELHRLEGPCGIAELQQFQPHLGADYQLMVLCRSKPFTLLYRGPEVPHVIRLLKSNHQYDGCTSFSAFVNGSYWCPSAERGTVTTMRHIIRVKVSDVACVGDANVETMCGKFNPQSCVIYAIFYFTGMIACDIIT